MSFTYVKKSWFCFPFLILTIKMLSATSILAQTVYDISTINHVINIGSKVPYIKSIKGKETLDSILSYPSKAWTISEDRALNFAYTDLEHWVSIDITNQSSTPLQRFLTYNYPLIDELEVFLIDQNNQILQHYQMGDRIIFGKRPIPNRNFVVPIHLKANEKIRIITRLWSTEALWVPIQIWEINSFYASDSTEVTLRGIYYGIVLIMAFYNLFVFFSIRQSMYLFYFFFVLFLALYQASEYGFAYQYLWPNSPWWAEKLPNVFTSGSLLLALVFTISFLDIRDRKEWLYKVCKLLRWGTLFLMLTSLLLPTRSIAVGVVIYAGCTLPIIFAVGFKRMFEGSVEARYFTISWSFILIGNFTYVFTLLDILPTNIITTNAPQIGSGLEVILLSLGLGRKLKVLHDENLTMQTKLARELQEKVEERTQALAAKTLEAQEASKDAIMQRKKADFLRHQAEQHAAKLEEIDRQKTHFFQNISHELRTPLTLILNPLELSQQTRPDDTELKIALKNTRRLLRLVNQLLDFQRVRAGRKTLHLQPINLSKFAVSCADYVKSACQSKGIQFQLQIDDKDIWVKGEVDALEKVTFNLLSNAIKFTSQGGRIELKLIRDDKNKAILSVIDSGVGISPEEQAIIFEVFTQSQVGERREYEGSGLGLALAKSLIEEMEGEIGVFSQVELGSQFWFSLHTCEIPEVSAPLLVKGWDHLEYEGKTGIDTDQVAQLNLSGEQETILVVDDLSDMRILIRRFLHDFNYQVITASSGFQALQILEKIRPSLMITDWMMPKMSGLDLITQVRQQKELNSLPIVLLTAKSDDEAKILGLHSGADAFLGKPFNSDELGSVIRNLLALKTREREVEALNTKLTTGVLRRYLPEPIIQQIIEGSLTLNEKPHAADVTILFSDLVGFTNLSEKLGAIKLSEILDEYLRSMSEIIFQYGGTIDKFIGDAIMVVFGTPISIAPQEQAKKAAQCSYAMQLHLKKLTKQWEAKYQLSTPIKMRIGLHFGPVVVGMFGTQRRSDYTIVGPHVNLASRIEGVCRAGEVYTSTEISDLLPSTCTQFVDEFDIKGLEMKVPLYKLISITEI